MSGVLTPLPHHSFVVCLETCVFYVLLREKPRVEIDWPYPPNGDTTFLWNVSVLYQTIRCNIPEDDVFHSCRARASKPTSKIRVEYNTVKWLCYLKGVGENKTWQYCGSYCFNPLAPSDPYICHTAQLTSRSWILNTYSTNIRTEYFKLAA
jgi:hypothetical protein